MEFQLLQILAAATLILQSFVSGQPVEISTVGNTGTMALEAGLGGAHAGGGAAGGALTAGMGAGSGALTAGTGALEAGISTGSGIAAEAVPTLQASAAESNALLQAVANQEGSGLAGMEGVLGMAREGVALPMSVASQLGGMDMGLINQLSSPPSISPSVLGQILTLAAAANNPLIAIPTAVKAGVDTSIDFADQTTGQLGLGIKQALEGGAGALDSGLEVVGFQQPMFRPMASTGWQIAEGGRKTGFDATRNGVNGAFFVTNPLAAGLSNQFRFGNRGGMGGNAAAQATLSA